MGNTKQSTHQRTPMRSYILNLYKKHNIPLPKNNGGMVTDDFLWGNFIEEMTNGCGRMFWGNIYGDINNQGDLRFLLNTKVDKINGKGLSTNDFSNSFLNKLLSIEYGAEVNVNSDWNATSGDAEILNKPTIPIVNDGVLSLFVNDNLNGTFSANQSANKEINLIISKYTIGLGNVDDTSDANKPVSNATQAALNTKIGSIIAGTSNVIINNSDPINPIISVSTTNIPQIFTTSINATGSIGDNGNLQITELTPINGVSSPNVGDKIIFHNAYQGQIITILSNNVGYIIIDIPISTSWGNISGILSNQTDLQIALEDKQDKITATGNTNLLVAPATVGGQPTLKPISDFQTALNRTIRFIGDTVSVPTATTDNGNDLTFTLNTLSAEKLKNGKTIAIGGKITGSATSFDGSGNITIPVTALSSNPTDYPILNQDTTGNAATASKWETPRTITLQGDINSNTSTNFDGSTNITITNTLIDKNVIANTRTASLPPSTTFSIIENITYDQKGRLESINTFNATLYDGGVNFNPIYELGSNLFPAMSILGNTINYDNVITFIFNVVRPPRAVNTLDTNGYGTVRLLIDGTVSAPAQGAMIVLYDYDYLSAMFETFNSLFFPNSYFTIERSSITMPVGNISFVSSSINDDVKGGCIIFTNEDGDLLSTGSVFSASNSARFLIDITLPLSISNVFNLSGLYTML